MTFALFLCLCLVIIYNTHKAMIDCEQRIGAENTAPECFSLLREPAESTLQRRSGPLGVYQMAAAAATIRSSLPVCPKQVSWNPNRLVSLWDIVNQFNMRSFLHGSFVLREMRCTLMELRRLDKTAVVNAESHEAIVRELHHLHKMCEESDFPASRSKIYFVLQRMAIPNYSAEVSGVISDLYNIDEVLVSEMWKHKFLRISDSNAAFVDQDALFGSNVIAEAADDIKAAGNCLACECNTAAVFHLMRAAEWGLRALCSHLGIIKTVKTKKSGKKKYVPIEYTQWERMLEDAQTRIDKKIEKLAAGKRKQELQEFYYPLLSDLNGFKDAWRNHVMHTRASYSPQDAIAIFDHVKRFMSSLAAGLERMRA